MDDVNLARDLARMLERFREAGAAIAKGAHVGQVLEAFGECEPDANLRQGASGTAQINSASVESVFITTETAAPTVAMLQMDFREGITLGALQRELGAWYRDPPEPKEAAYTSAYFDPKRIDPGAPFLLRALIEEWCDGFTPYTLVNSLHIEFDDSREVSDRPW